MFSKGELSMSVKLDTLPLRKFSRFYSAIAELNEQKGSSVVIDLKNSLLRFATSCFAGQISLSLLWDSPNESATALDDIMIPGEKFFSIVNEYPEISFDGDVIVTSDGRYDLGALHEKNEWPTFKKVLPSSIIIAFSGDNAVGPALVDAAPFASKDVMSAVNGVFIKGDRVIGTDRSLMYDRQISTSVKDVNIPLSLWGAVASLPYPEVKLSWDEGLLRLEATDDSLRVNFASKDNLLEAPDVSDPEFREAFDHPTTVEVSSSAILDALRFFDNFTRSAPHNRIKVYAASETELVIEAVDGVAAVRRLPAVISPELVADKFAWFSSKNLVKAIDALGKTDNLTIALDYDGVAADLHASGPNDRHVIVALLEE